MENQQREWDVLGKSYGTQAYMTAQPVTTGDGKSAEGVGCTWEVLQDTSLHDGTTSYHRGGKISRGSGMYLGSPAGLEPT